MGIGLANGPGDPKDQYKWAGRDVQCKGLRHGTLGRGVCPKAAFKVKGSRLPRSTYESFSTTLFLQHSCLDGKEARPTVLLANVQARKSYKKATSLQK